MIKPSQVFTGIQALPSPVNSTIMKKGGGTGGSAPLILARNL